jgi:hypothetical protein
MLQLKVRQKLYNFCLNMKKTHYNRIILNCREPVSESNQFDKTLYEVLYSVAHMCVLLGIIPVCYMRGRRVGQAAVGLGEGEVFLGLSG